MDDSGRIRFDMADQYNEEMFLKEVADTISKEFDKEIIVLEIGEGRYIINFGEYSLELTKQMIKKLKTPLAPYKLDRFILESFEVEGFEFDKRRSEYTREVFSLFDN